MRPHNLGWSVWLRRVAVVVTVQAASVMSGFADEPRPVATPQAASIVPTTAVPTPPWLMDPDERPTPRPDDRGMLTALAVSPPPRPDVRTPTAVQLIAEHPRGMPAGRIHFRWVKPIE